MRLVVAKTSVKQSANASVKNSQRSKIIIIIIILIIIIIIERSRKNDNS